MHGHIRERKENAQLCKLEHPCFAVQVLLIEHAFMNCTQMFYD